MGFWKSWEFEYFQLCFFSIWVIADVFFEYLSICRCGFFSICRWRFLVFAEVGFWVFESLQMCFFEYLSRKDAQCWVLLVHSCVEITILDLIWTAAHNYLSSLWPQEHRGKIELTVLPFSCSLTYLSLAMRAIYKWQGTILDLRYTLQVSRASRIPQSKRTDNPVSQLWWESTDERPCFQKA